MRRVGAVRYKLFAAGEEQPSEVVYEVASRLAKSPAWPVLRIFFSFFVWLSSLGLMTIIAIAIFVMTPIANFNRTHNWLGGAALARCLSLAGAKPKITWDPDFDPERRGVFAQNHISMLDAHVACTAIPHAFCGLMNHWHFRIPGYGWLMKLGNSIAVYPRSAGRTAEITEAAKDRVAAGISILVFPEGHRTRDGNVRDYKRGTLFMARDAGIPVVPVAVRGLYEVNHRGAWRFQPGEVEIYVGPHVETADLSDDGVTELAAKLTRFADKWVREGVADTALLDTAVLDIPPQVDAQAHTTAS